jgi:hypothetical protein
VRWRSAFDSLPVIPRLAAAYACCGQWQAVCRTLEADTPNDLQAALLALAHHRLGNTTDAERWRDQASSLLSSRAGTTSVRRAIVTEILDLVPGAHR